MTAAVLLLVAGAWLYTYAGYPALLWLIARGKPQLEPAPDPDSWPHVSIVIPVYNEAATIAGTLSEVLGLDYPVDRRQVLVVSDASTDDTDAIVAAFADRGVELLRQPVRAGKTAGETEAGRHVRGEIVVTLDAATRLPRGALKALIRPMQDRSIGVVSGRDVSVAAGAAPGASAGSNDGEAAYVSYEMQLRDLETRLYGIVGASGCFFAMRADLYRLPLPPSLSRDFASALLARQHGFRSIAAPQAACYVSRSSSLAQEYRRKVRTMARGLATLWHLRALLNPRRYGAFAWMLWSHKVSRWVLPWTIPLGLIALAGAAPGDAWARWGLAVAVASLLAGGVAWLGLARIPSISSRAARLGAYVVLGTTAGLHAWGRVLRGGALHTWEPTRREVESA